MRHLAGAVNPWGQIPGYDISLSPLVDIRAGVSYVGDMENIRITDTAPTTWTDDKTISVHRFTITSDDQNDHSIVVYTDHTNTDGFGLGTIVTIDGNQHTDTTNKNAILAALDNHLK